MKIKTKERSTAANCAAAIREELKAKFPGVKFSVTSSNFSMGNSVDIRWTEGPSTPEVQSITGKYQYGHFNSMDDMYESTNRRDDIPQAKYVQTSRELSKEARANLEEVIEAKFEDNQTRRDILHRIFYKASFPAGAILTGIESAEETAGLIEDLYRISFTAPGKAKVIQLTKNEELELVPYSDKALALFGNTKPIKEELKRIGGRFNPYLQHMGKKVAGWIFSKSKEQELKTLLGY